MSRGMANVDTSGRWTLQWQLLCCPSVWELTVSNPRGVSFLGSTPLICNVNIGPSINVWHCETDENGKFFKWCSVSAEMYCYNMTKLLRRDKENHLKGLLLHWFKKILCYLHQFWVRDSQGVLFQTWEFLGRTCGLCCWLVKSQEWQLRTMLFLLHVHAF